MKIMEFLKKMRENREEKVKETIIEQQFYIDR